MGSKVPEVLLRMWKILSFPADIARIWRGPGESLLCRKRRDSATAAISQGSLDASFFGRGARNLLGLATSEWVIDCRRLLLEFREHNHMPK